jgi:hypothetical protein
MAQSSENQSPENEPHATEHERVPPRPVTVGDAAVVLGSLAVFVVGVILVIAFAIR